jgi:hypothetical protein
VLFTGLSLGTLFTLFSVPAVDLLIGADHAHDVRARAREAQAAAAGAHP